MGSILKQGSRPYRPCSFCIRTMKQQLRIFIALPGTRSPLVTHARLHQPHAVFAHHLSRTREAISLACTYPRREDMVRSFWRAADAARISVTVQHGLTAAKPMARAAALFLRFGCRGKHEPVVVPSAPTRASSMSTVQCIATVSVSLAQNRLSHGNSFPAVWGERETHCRQAHNAPPRGIRT
jgi:hypothetical protein